MCDYDPWGNDHGGRAICGTELFLFIYAAVAKGCKKGSGL